MEYGKYNLEQARAMARTRIMEPPLAVLDPRTVEVDKPPRIRLQGKRQEKVHRRGEHSGVKASLRGDGGRGGEKGRDPPMKLAGSAARGGLAAQSQTRKRLVGKQAAGTAKYPVKFPTEAQLRDNAGRRAAMLARDGLDATRLQDRLGSLRP